MKYADTIISLLAVFITIIGVFAALNYYNYGRVFGKLKVTPDVAIHHTYDITTTTRNDVHRLDFCAQDSRCQMYLVARETRRAKLGHQDSLPFVCVYLLDSSGKRLTELPYAMSIWNGELSLQYPLHHIEDGPGVGIISLKDALRYIHEGQAAERALWLEENRKRWKPNKDGPVAGEPVRYQPPVG